MLQRTPKALALLVCVLLIACLFPLAAMAGPDTWTEIADDGIGGGYGAYQSAAVSSAAFGPDLYVGTAEQSQVWRSADGSSWTKCNTDGFGDPANSVLQDLIAFDGYLYAGTGYENAQVWRTADGTSWQQINVTDFGDGNNRSTGSFATYSGDLYAGTVNTSGAQVWRFDGPGAGDWTEVTGDWTEDAGCDYTYEMLEFGTYLYVAIGNSTTGCEIWRYDGEDWSQINVDGFGTANNENCLGLASFNGALYAGVSDYSPAARVFRFDGPDPDDWTQVNTDGFGGQNFTIQFLEVSGTFMYAGTGGFDGAEVWRTDDGTNWSSVATGGFGFDDINYTYSMSAFGGDLYITTQTGRIFRSTDGATWGPTGKPGFALNSNSQVSSMVANGPDLYVGTYDDSHGCSVYRYDGDTWSLINAPGFGDAYNTEATSMAIFGSKLYVGTKNENDYCEVWRYDGPTPSDWTQVADAGFGSEYNYEASAMATWGNALYVGTYNDDVGCNVWRYDGSDWVALNEDGFGAGYDNRCVEAIQVFGDNLYFGTWDLCQVVRYDGSSFVKVNTDHFGDSDNDGVYSMAAFDSFLYAGTDNYSSGCQLWRSPDGNTWTQVGGSGLGDPSNSTLTSLAVGGGCLYAGASNFEAACKIYTSFDGLNWGQDSEAGFGNVNNNDPELASYADQVCCGTWNMTDGCQVWTTRIPYPVVGPITPDSADRGTTIVTAEITGLGFFGTPIVKLTRPGGAEIQATNVVVESSTTITCSLAIPADAYVGNWNLYVRNPDGQEATNIGMFTVTEPTPPVTATPWYLAEGTTAWGFSTYITIENPNSAALNAKLTYMDPSPAAGAGAIASRTVRLAPLSQTTVDPRWDLGDTDFSTKVECLEGEQIAVDRTMFWTGGGAAAPEAHSSIGASEASKTWYLPEGSTRWGFETWTLVQNPGGTPAHVTVTYMTQDAGAKRFEKTIPPRSRASYSMAADIGEHDSSIEVTSDVPVIAERSMYRNNRREGSCSVGSTAPATTSFLAEGTTAWGFTTYLLVQNPNDSDATVTLTCMTPDGPVPQEPFTMGANSRRTVKLNDALPPPGSDVSTLVEADRPVVAERAMYWDSSAGEAMHDSVGLSESHMTFMLPDGQSSGGCETWTLVANPNPGAVTVQVTYLPENGGEAVTFKDEIPPGSRRTFNMAGGDGYKEIEGRASILVRSLDGARPIMVERAMYWNGRTAGTDTVGAPVSPTD